MQDQDKTKEQLVDELREMRQKVSVMGATEARLLGTKKALREGEERFPASGPERPFGLSILGRKLPFP